MPDPAAPPGYADLHEAAAWAELPGRTVVDVRGDDAAAFVNRFATNTLATLLPGSGAETFFTDAKGWVLALATALRTEDGLWIDADAGLATPLADHLEHYHIRERLEIVDASATAALFLVAGPRAADWLASHAGAVGVERFDHRRLSLAGRTVRIARGDWIGPDCFLIRVDEEARPGLADWLAASGLPKATPDAVAAARIEWGRPGPTDMPEKTLPQELLRDDRAISFTKGCYLGQETVARIDALGHVNRRLTGVMTTAGLPRIGAEVRRGPDVIGTISSTCWSPRLGAGLGLTLLRGAGPEEPLLIDGLAGCTTPLPVPRHPITREDRDDDDSQR